jgi:hypothetical protein
MPLPQLDRRAERGAAAERQSSANVEPGVPVPPEAVLGGERPSLRIASAVQERLSMSLEGTAKFALGIFTVLDKAPSASGVYALFAGERWVHIGEADNIQLRLL